jgi:Tfp pilus assembly protein PilF
MNRIDSSFSLKSDLLSCLLIAVVCLLSYSNTFHAPFQLDDSFHISEKAFVKDTGAFFDPEKLEHYRADSAFRMRTVAYFTLALNYRIHGSDVVGYHVVNLIVHIINSILVYFLVLLTFRTPRFDSHWSTVIGHQSSVSVSTLNSQLSTRLIPLFAALLFASHPVQTQAVTYIIQRTASLATLFFLLSLVMYVKWRLASQRQVEAEVKAKVKKVSASALTFFVFSFFSAILAMKTKEIAFTLPLVIALYEFIFFGGGLKKRMLFLVPLLLTMLIIPLELVGLERPAGAVMGEMNSALRASSDLSRWGYLFTQFRVIVTYIRLLFFPVNQNLDYDYPVYHSFFDPHVFLSFLFLLAILGFGIYCLYYSRIPRPSSLISQPSTFSLQPFSRLIAFGIFWFFITLSVESSIIPIADVIFEHRLYLPSIGFFIAVATVVSIVVERVTNISKVWAKIAVGALGLIIIILSGATYVRNSLWKDEVRMWEDVVKKSPQKVRPHSNLGHFYGKRVRFEDAIREYNIALRLDPYDYQIHNNLGVIYKGQGRLAEATEEYRKALMLNPEDAMAHYNLGNIFREQGNFEEAINHYQAAIRLEPEVEVAVIHNNLGIAYIGLGNLKDAEREFRAAIELNPDYGAARRNLEMLLSRGGGQ